MGRGVLAATAALVVVLTGLGAAGCRSTGGGGGGSSVSMFGGSVDIAALPTTVEDFTALRDQIATSPAGGAAAFVVALYVYTQDEDLGLACLTVAIDRSQLVEGGRGTQGLQPSNAEIQRFRERIRAQPHVARSYFKGTSPENGYALPPLPLKVAIKRGDAVGDGRKVFVYSSGADSPRPIVLKENNRGLWKAYEWSSLGVGVRKPVVKVDDDL